MGRKLLTPKVTNPGPLAFGLNPSTLSFSVGSDLETHTDVRKYEYVKSMKEAQEKRETNHNKSIRTIEPASIVIGRWIFSICST